MQKVVENVGIPLKWEHFAQLLQITLELCDEDPVRLWLRRVSEPSEEGLVGVTLTRPPGTGDWNCPLGPAPVIKQHELCVEAGGRRRSWGIVDAAPNEDLLPSDLMVFGPWRYKASLVRRAYIDVFNHLKTLCDPIPEEQMVELRLVATGEVVIFASDFSRVLTPIV